MDREKWKEREGLIINIHTCFNITYGSKEGKGNGRIWIHFPSLFSEPNPSNVRKIWRDNVSLSSPFPSFPFLCLPSFSFPSLSPYYFYSNKVLLIIEINT